MKKWIGVLAALGLIAILAACGGSKEPAGAQESTDDANAKVITIAASNYQFDQEEYRAKAGETVKFVLENKQGIHGVAIKGLDVDLDPSNTSQTVTLNEPGTYEIYCSINCGAGHANMRAKLIVE